MTEDQKARLWQVIGSYETKEEVYIFVEAIIAECVAEQVMEDRKVRPDIYAALTLQLAERDRVGSALVALLKLYGRDGMDVSAYTQVGDAARKLWGGP